MRFDDLLLARYGVFSDFRLDLSGDDIRLHVVHGPNEAGKSTALAAICDLLFGIPGQTPYAFRHGYNDLSLGATLRNRAGQVLEVRRRKGNKNTLLDPQGSPLADGALAPFLGGVTREAFERRFGLDYDRLRHGGDQMLEAEGDLARSLFEASSGIPSVLGLLDELKAAGDTLGSPQRKAAQKPLWLALEKYDDARKLKDREALRSDAWKQAEEALRSARAEWDGLRAALDALRQERHRVARLRQVLPLLIRIDALTQALDEQADALDLPPDFADSWRAVDAEVTSATTTTRHLAARLEGVQPLFDALPPAGRLPDHGARIERLFAQSGQMDSLRADLPKLERDIALSTDRLQRLADDLGVGLNAAGPTRPLVARLHDRIAQRGALDVDLQAKAEQAAKARQRLQAVTEALAALGCPADPATAAAALAEAQAAGDVEQRVAATHAVATDKAAAADLALQRLPGWTGGLDALRTAPFPDAEAVQAALTDRKALAEDRVRATEAQAQAAEDGRRCQAELESLAAGGEVPTPEALAAARRHREAGWGWLRRVYIDGGGGDAAEARQAYGADLPAAYEQAVRHADDLVDRREREAQRVQRYLTLQRQRQDAQAALTREQDRGRDLDRRLALAEAQWLALWQGCGVVPAAPGPWLRQKDEVLRAAEAARQAAVERDQLRDRLDEVRGHFLRAERALGLDATPATVPMPALRQRVSTAVQTAVMAWADGQRLRQEAQARRGEAEAADAALAEARHRDGDWRQQWSADMPGIGLSPDAGPADARAALEVWTQIEDEREVRRNNQRRLSGIRKDLAALSDEVTALLAVLGEALSAEERALPPLELPPLLHQRLKEQREAQARRRDLSDQLDILRRDHREARQQLDDAERRRAALRQRHGLAEDTDALAAAARAEEVRALRRRLAETRAELPAGHAEDALRAEAAGAQADVLEVRAQAIEEDEESLQARRDAANNAVLRAEQELDRLQALEGVGQAAQDVRDAELDAAQLTGRWVRLWAAQYILTHAIQRFRDANEHPLVRRASALLAMIAGHGDNPIDRLTVAYGRKDQPVLVGVRRDGSHCLVEGMSDGTRDQLYLALRIAAVEAAAAESEPLPFIADDLFITSDDTRTVPGLRALAELGRHTQVLLFTHHDSVVEAARQAVEALRVHSLVRG